MTAPEGDAASSATAITEELLAELRARASDDNVVGMKRFGISAHGTLGIPMPVVRSLAREAKRRVGRDKSVRHELALALWASGVHEARIMAALLDEPSLVDEAQADAWANDLDSWDVCDQLAINLLRRCPFAWAKAAEWTSAEPEFVKRLGFAMGATLAVHEKTAENARFLPLLECAVREAPDERNGVKKAANWQIRQIGKRSAALNAAAIDACERILAEHPDSKAARWVARGALRELKSDKVRRRLGID